MPELHRVSTRITRQCCAAFAVGALDDLSATPAPPHAAQKTTDPGVILRATTPSIEACAGERWLLARGLGVSEQIAALDGPGDLMLSSWCHCVTHDVSQVPHAVWTQLLTPALPAPLNVE
jgi:hypothetical protein